VNLQVAAEEIVAVAAHTVNREVVSECSEGTRYDVFRRESFPARRTAVYTARHCGAIA
jgi:hypothetical protein